MTIAQHLTHFAGKPVVDWPPASDIQDPTQIVYRLRLSYEEADEGLGWIDKFGDFLGDPATRELAGFVVGIWNPAFIEDSSSTRIVEALVAARDRLTNLTAIFLGDITYEECEISWIEQTGVSPLLNAYPQLEHFGVRGGNGLSFGAAQQAYAEPNRQDTGGPQKTSSSFKDRLLQLLSRQQAQSRPLEPALPPPATYIPLQHDHLKWLVVESGGLGADVVRQITDAQLPALEHLELWLGDSNYGADVTVEDLAPILAGDRFPNLRYLGLRDSEIADEIAVAVARAPILDRIRVLDLSLGTLGNEGAAALLTSPAVATLEMLDIHHHYCTESVTEQFQRLGIRVDTSQRLEPDEYEGESWRYVAVGE